MRCERLLNESVRPVDALKWSILDEIPPRLVSRRRAKISLSGLLKIALQHAGMKFDEQTTRTHSYPDVELTMIDTNPLSGKRIQLNTAMPAMVSIPTTTGM